MKQEQENRWEDNDTHLQAVEEHRAEVAEFRDNSHPPRPWGDKPYRPDDDVAHPAVDAYREAARERLRVVMRSEPGMGFAYMTGMDPGALQARCEEARRDYDEKRRQAQLAVRFAERLGEEVPAETRRLAETPSKAEQIEQHFTRREEERSAALRETLRGAQGYGDGTFARPLTQPRDIEFAAQETLQRSSQVRRHAAMAQAGHVPTAQESFIQSIMRRLGR
jgi:hypothetical protein